MQIVLPLPPHADDDPVVLAFARRGATGCEACAEEPMSTAARGLALALIAMADALDDVDDGHEDGNLRRRA